MPRPGSSCRLLLALTLGAVCSAVSISGKTPVVTMHGVAYIGHDPSSKWWSVGNDAVEIEVGFNQAGVLAVRHLWNPTSEQGWDIGESPDVGVTIDGTPLLLNASNSVMSLTSTATEDTEAGVQIVFTFEHRTSHLVIKKVFACYPGSPTFETWTRLEAPPRSPPIQVSNLAAWQFDMQAESIRWINGLRGGNADSFVPDSFTITNRELGDGEDFAIGSERRSSEEFEPIVFVDNGSKEFYGGVIWSGAWQIAMSRSADRLTIHTAFPGTTTSLTPGHPIEYPHAFFGFTERSTMAESAALRQFVLKGIRKGRPFQPLVTFNTWFSYGATVNEGNVYDELLSASALGVELFVLDAGWYQGSGAEGKGDFTSGLGSWKVDEDRFPGHLLEMADFAHMLGMKFGIWVEPERIALSLVDGDNMPPEDWLATRDGSYEGDGRSAQLCLASTAARQWVLDRLVELIDTVHPDYLKWDNNFWINCNREGHQHGPDDGNFAHVQALYGLLDEIRQRYPDLLIENVSGGGNRLDYGMIAYSDAAWMDDGTTPSSRVRHNLEGLSPIFPPAYLLSFVIDSESEPMRGSDLAQITRSRMPGILGLTYRGSEVIGEVSTLLAAEISRYKTLRDTTISQASAVLLGGQAPVDQEGWDVIQEVSDDQRNAIIFAFKNDAADGRVIVHPRNLLPDKTYNVRSLDNGEMGTTTGADVMRDGIELVHAEAGSRAHLILFTAQPEPEPAPEPDNPPPGEVGNQDRPR